MGKKLFVGNLPFSATEEQLSEAFGQAGSAESVEIIIARDPGRSKGFGFVEMASDAEAQKAIELMNGQDLGGRRLTVNEAKPMERREGGGGGRGAGRGYGDDGGGRGGYDRDRRGR